MTDHPILFSAPMVRALLNYSKRQTRRVLKPQPPAGARYIGVHFAGNEPDSHFFASPAGPHKAPVRIQERDRLWVREAHALVPRNAYRMSVGTGTIAQREHPTDGYTAALFREGFDRSGRPRWRPSIHMPRWASRLTLDVTQVRVQRLQDICEEDAIAEGIEDVTRELSASDPGLRFWKRYRDGAWNGYVDTAIGSYASLWTQINGPSSWEANPWVVAYSFSIQRLNIDEAW